MEIMSVLIGSEYYREQHRININSIPYRYIQSGVARWVLFCKQLEGYFNIPVYISIIYGNGRTAFALEKIYIRKHPRDVFLCVLLSERK